MTDSNVFEYKTVAFFTLGCKLNFAESSAIGKSLLEHGVRQARPSDVPDLCVVNTCSVTDLADKKCRHTIRKIHRDYPNARIIVTGCYAQLKPDEVANIDGVDMVLGANEKVDLVRYLDQLKEEGKTSAASHVLHTPINEISTFAPSLSSEGRTRHFLKVQDGCDYSCSYCTIPKARGRSRNGTIASLLEQAKQVVAEGGREIVLTGVNVGDFGRTTGESFLALVKALDEIEGIDRFRISSIEPNLITDEIISFVASSKRFAPHFHIPLQSGSDHVLKLMRRRYKSDLFAHKISLIRELIPHAFIGVDVIVGTRGETDEYFEEGYNFLCQQDVSKLHVFSYSERPGTDALKIEHVVDHRTKQKRSRRLLDLSEDKLIRFYQQQQGSTRRVLWEHRDSSKETPTQMYGFTENYIRVAAPYDEVLLGTVTEVTVGNILADEPEVAKAEISTSRPLKV